MRSGLLLVTDYSRIVVLSITVLVSGETNILPQFSGTYCLLLIALLINLCLAFVLSEDARACHLAQGNEINLSLTKQM